MVKNDSRSARNLYSKTGVSSEELDGLKEAMELLVSDKIRVYDVMNFYS